MPFCDVRRLTTPSTKAAGSASRPNRACSAALLAARRARRLRVEARGEIGVGRRIPHRVVDAVEDAGQHAGALAQQAVEPHAVLGRADLRGVGRRHRGDPVGEREARLEVADRAVILDAVDRVRVRRQADPWRAGSRGNWPWNDRLCTVMTVPRPRRAAVVEQRRDEARLPVVRVHDVGRVARDGAARDRGGARARARRSAARCRASPCRRGRRTDCPAARRDAARRARRDRAPRRAPTRSRAGPPCSCANVCATSASSQRVAAPPDSRGRACASRCLRARAPAAARRRRRRGRRS